MLSAMVPDLGAKEALLSTDPDVYFTTPHFDGYAVILVRLDRIDPAELEELVVGGVAGAGAEASGGNVPGGPLSPVLRQTTSAFLITMRGRRWCPHGRRG